ncbi:glycosyltransferase [Nocardioides sp. JQ2195]|uniref:bifunctional glycosyltransferase/CDP-glycerol:glycerophosphate glycerophosphotransferase n=1 Tax=Nocardioides sp. JQ2195 TaxID=2592334 RepID=UPI00143E79AE|nr:CDP-glycerol glycerophosphotransferase family protein [Nocardioides sp. JQ2195]QIX28190.1 glycosyltransferase [Nocardioides sp. JQ2195]
MSVVLTVSDEETTKIAPAIASLQQQRHGNLDVVVVAWGRSARVLATARRAAASDSRIRVVREPAADLAAARRVGVRRARGTYLAFLVGCDDLPPRGLERLVHSLEQSGSPFVVGMAEAPDTVLAATTAPRDAAHHRGQLGTTLERTPMAITDLGVGNRLFRRDFWKSAALDFDPGPGGESALALAAFAAADKFDLSRHTTYLRSQRRDAALGTLPVLLGTLDAWIKEQRLAWQVVQAMPVEGVADAWLWGVLDTAIQPFIDDVERATDHEWETLCETAELLLDRSGTDVSASLRAESRVRLWLLRERRRELLEEFVAQRWFEKGNRRTRVVSARVLAELPLFGDAEAGVPDDCFEMSEAETPLQAILVGVRWPDPKTAELDLFVRAQYVGMPGTPSISVDLTHPRSSTRVPVEVRQRTDVRANQLMADKYQDYSRGAVTLVVDTAALVDASAPLPGADTSGIDWEFRVTLETQGLRREGRIQHIDDRGSAGMLGTGHLGARSVGSSRVAVVAGGDTRAAVRVQPGLDVRLQQVSVDGRTVRGRLSGERLPVAVEATSGTTTCTAPVTDESFTLVLPKTTGGATWRFRVIDADGGRRMVAWPEMGQHWLCAGSGEVVPGRSVHGAVELREAADVLVLESVRLDTDSIAVTGEWLGAAPKHLRLTLRGARTVIEAESLEVTKGRLTARLPTTWDEWGFGPVPVPVGRYWFELSAGPPNRARTGKVLLSDQMIDGLLDQQLNESFRFRSIRLGRDAGVFLTAPVADEDRGGHNRQRLVDWANSDELPIEEDWVYFQSYTGATATDSQLAIFHEVRRTRPDLVCWWGVADLSSWVPEGARRVVISSAEWFRVLASSRRLVMNIDLDRWFSPRPGQELLQTFHGYPAKSMGVVLWEAKHYTPRRIAAELDRTSADWDLILTPAPEMDEHYRREYRYDGPIHNEGYPRDDVLVSDRANRVREETRARLGIAPGQKAVLYAPTWRDDQATNWRSAELTKHLDLEAASAQLGPDYVFLMRGHRFHARAGERSGSRARLLDVTDYPEINDLILASDAAVLDYSSLRFDFALTRRPMLFLVPDLSAYVRGFLYSFEDSAPGPLLDTADQVIARLRDLPALTEEYADQVARFNATYNRFQDGKAAKRVVRAFFGQ